MLMPMDVVVCAVRDRPPCCGGDCARPPVSMMWCRLVGLAKFDLAAFRCGRDARCILVGGVVELGD